jgi:hypothetical protein
MLQPLMPVVPSTRLIGGPSPSHPGAGPWWLTIDVFVICVSTQVNQHMMSTKTRNPLGFQGDSVTITVAQQGIGGSIGTIGDK